MRPAQERVEGERRRFIPDRGEIVVGQRRRDEGVGPRVVPCRPVAHDRGKLAGLHLEVSLLPRDEAHRVFVGPQAQARVGRVEAAVDPRLGKRIHPPAELRIEEQREPRVHQPRPLGEHEVGHGLLGMVALEVEQPVQTRTPGAVARADRERLAHAIEPLLGPGGARSAAERREHDGAGEQAEGRCGDVSHACGASGTPRTADAGRKVTSNSVLSSSERTSRRLPPCRSASSWARFRPRP